MRIPGALRAARGTALAATLIPALMALLPGVPGRGDARTPAKKRPGGRDRSYWVLKGAERDFYICATAGPRDWRAALCVFDSKEAAEAHLASLGEAQMFLDTLEHYGAYIPYWMRREPLLPEVREVPATELRRVLCCIGVRYATLNPPPAGERTETLKLLPAESFPGGAGCGGPGRPPGCPYGPAP
jgi:hypothetical protein